jgi:hypothetical protein
MTTPGSCRDCRHFINDPAQIEALIPGLTAMGSAWASVRSDDGICAIHDRIVSARDGCDSFLARPRMTIEGQRG